MITSKIIKIKYNKKNIPNNNSKKLILIQERFQKLYNYLVITLKSFSLSCACGSTDCFHNHAYYFRYIKTPYGKIKIKILRVKCTKCGKTHAILPSSIVPYSQVFLGDHLRIIRYFLSTQDYQSIIDGNPFIDQSNIYYIIKQFKQHWQKRIISKKIDIQVSPTTITKKCFEHFKAQFMQVRTTSNILFIPPT